MNEGVPSSVGVRRHQVSGVGFEQDEAPVGAYVIGKAVTISLSPGSTDTHALRRAQQSVPHKHVEYTVRVPGNEVRRPRFKSDETGVSAHLGFSALKVPMHAVTGDAYELRGTGR